MAEVARLDGLKTSDDVSRHRLSASTLNEGGSLQNATTPDVEMSQVSQPVLEEKTEGITHRQGIQ